MVYILENYNDILTVDDLMKILHIGRNTTYLYLQSGEIPNKKIRNRYIIPKIGLINYLANIA